MRVTFDFLIALACAGLVVIALIRRFVRGVPWKGKPIAAPANDQKVAILYATQKGTSRSLAHKLFTRLNRHRMQAQANKDANVRGIALPVVLDLASVEAEALTRFDVIVFIVSTYTEGQAPPASSGFETDLKDMAQDFRYGAGYLRNQRVAVFGLGDSAYGHNFNRFAKNVTDWVTSLGAEPLTPSSYASESKLQPMWAAFVKRLLEAIDAPIKSACCSTAGGKCGCTGKTSGAARDDDSDDSAAAEDDGGGGHVDLEDLVDDDTNRPELLYPRLRESLTKQGYRLIGSHSGVKLCRWTKAMLRGRGGCYKHTFYNITSYQCMEMTPSLACANKCVFCWRHHTNPVGKAFTWKVDPPEFLIEEAISAHRSMLKPLRGVPGMNQDRLREAMNVRHCALSLVGEPIMYPEISRFVDILHSKRISSFLVTNAQFPERIRDLSRVTQLYLSIDAATPDSLKRIDRPLFDDYWDRMLNSIREMRHRKERTVFRLTLVEGYNTDTIREYCQLIDMGTPDFIEVKGVTYCGSSDASPLTMKHVPYHSQVVDFCVAIVAQLNSRFGACATGMAAGAPRYSIACEHEHSCCILIAHEKFRVNGVWHTWIDYSRFFELMESGATDFTALDYVAPTPGWATFASQQRGFDPDEVRHHRKSSKPAGSGC